MKKYLLITLAALVLFGCSSDDKHGWKTGDKCDVKKMENLNGTECQDGKLVTCVNSHAEVHKCNMECTVNNNVAMCGENVPIAGNNTGTSNGNTATLVKNGECGDISSEGRCQGNVLWYCNSGKLAEMDCSQTNQVCGMNRGRFYDCIDSNVARPAGNTNTPQPTVTECGNITENGVCDGSIALLCIKNSLASIDCKDLGRTCGLDANGKVDCIASNTQPSGGTNKPADPVRPENNQQQQPQQQNGCGNITGQGACSGNILRTCTDNELKTVNCSTLNLACGYDNSVGRYNCIQPASEANVSNCGSITEIGICDGTVLKFCDNKQLVTYDCKQREMTCGKDSKGEYACVTQPSQQQEQGGSEYEDGADCGDITGDGICDGNFSIWCDEGKLVKETCENGCVVDGDGYAVCKVLCGNIDSNGICEGKSLKYCMNDTLTTVDCDETSCVSAPSGYSQCYAPCDEGMKPGDSVCEEDSQVACFEDLGLTVMVCGNGCINGVDEQGEFGVCKP